MLLTGADIKVVFYKAVELLLIMVSFWLVTIALITLGLSRILGVLTGVKMVTLDLLVVTLVVLPLLLLTPLFSLPLLLSDY